MAQPYVGEIRLFAGNFAPAGWMFCDGSLLPISNYDTLFNLIGTTYGGDGQSTFQLPDLRGRVPIHIGPGFPIAASGGVENVTLTVSQIPSHGHSFMRTPLAGEFPYTSMQNLRSWSRFAIRPSGVMYHFSERPPSQSHKFISLFCPAVPPLMSRQYLLLPFGLSCPSAVYTNCWLSAPLLQVHWTIDLPFPYEPPSTSMQPLC